MTKVTCDMAMSVDGFVAGPNQSLENPFGEGVEGRLHRWMLDEPDENAAALEGILAAKALEPLGVSSNHLVTHLAYGVPR